MNLKIILKTKDQPLFKRRICFQLYAERQQQTSVLGRWSFYCHSLHFIVSYCTPHDVCLFSILSETRFIFHTDLIWI
jgi:hypothetical protein